MQGRAPRVPGWVNSRLPSRRTIHTVAERLVRLTEDKPVAVFSLNIHDRKSKVDHKNYDLQCRNSHLQRLANMFRREKVNTNLLVLVAESTIYRPHPTESNKFRVRGGHISAALVTLPPLEDEKTPIRVELPISKLPGGKNREVSADASVNGKSLIDQNFKETAHFESPDNYMMYRDSNTTIDYIGGNSAPVLFAILSLDDLGIDYQEAFQQAQKLAALNPAYIRLGNACGEYVFESFGGKIPTNASRGMSTQSSFALTLDQIAKDSNNPRLCDAVKNALRDINAYYDPEKMCILGDTLKKEYQAGQLNTNKSESSLTVTSDNDKGNTETHEPNQGGPQR